LLQTTIIALLRVSDILHMYIDFYSTSLPFPPHLPDSVQAHVDLSLRSRSTFILNWSLTGHAATPEEKREGWDRHWAGL